MRGAGLILLTLLPGLAQAQGLVVGGTQDGTTKPQNCMQVIAGTALAYGCMNAQQRALVKQHRAALAATTPNAQSAPPSLGLYNRAATREQFGSTFGHSVIPQALPPANYGNPVIPR
jgi:hypothetical protein